MDIRRARALTERAISEAQARFGRPICIALCDPNGFLLDFARMEGAPVRSIAISQGKAYTAARIGTTTTAFKDKLNDIGVPAGAFCDPALTPLPGGAVLRDASGGAIGAVGISGLAPSEDQDLADQIAGWAAEG